MPKYNKNNFYQVNKSNHNRLFECQNLNISDRVLYFVLLKLENDLTNTKKSHFYRSIQDLMKDTKLSNKTIVNSLNRLNKYGFIKKWRKHKTRSGSGKKTRETITYIEVL